MVDDIVKKKLQGARSLSEVLYEAGRRLGRSPDEIQPYVNVLRSQWYDSMESLQGLNQDDLKAIGLPMRFGKELILVVNEGQERRERSEKFELTDDASMAKVSFSSSNV